MKQNLVPTGTIVMWSGSIQNIPNGWKLCDGSNNTPDLRDRFILGGGGPLSRRDKELMADLYERYRAVRRLCRRQSTGDLISIPEHTPLDLSLASPRQMRLRANSDCEMTEAGIENIEVVRSESREAAARLDCDLKWHHMTSRELNETLGKLKESKKVYKRQINEVESGTSTLETDSQVYALYKATKYNIKLIKALIEKQAK